MLACKPSRLLRPCDSGANARNFVRSDRHARAGAADQNALFDASMRHCLPDFSSVIRIVNGLFRRRAQVFDFKTEFLKERFEPLFLGVACVVTCERYSHPRKTSKVTGK